MRRPACFPLALLFAFATPGPLWASEASGFEWIPKETRSAARKLALRDLEGKKQQLADLKGKIVVLNFWATWCGPCRDEMPAFVRIHAEYRDRGVQIVGAANEERESRAMVADYTRSMGIQFPIWLEASVEHMEAFGVGPELPATVIIDPKGRLALRIRGVTDEPQLRALLDRLLLEAAPPQTAPR
jgi:thiol-disulfide isomerase/thioredoxin